MIAELRDYLKTLNVATHYTIGKLDNSKDQSLCVYPDFSTPRVEAVGLQSSYNTYGVRILLHWNKNAKESETAAINLFNKIRYITETLMTDAYVYYINWYYDAPISLGTDDNGVYEYVIQGIIYYRR